MKLWVLEPVNSRAHPWSDFPDADATIKMVIRAHTEEQARQLAKENGMDETRLLPSAWTDPILSTCTELRGEGPLGLICRQ